jgi:NTP pyrophosphatase (non-canonical NTP hydrolase)
MSSFNPPTDAEIMAALGGAVRSEAELCERIRIQFPRTLEEYQVEVRQINEANGWFESERTFGEDIALLHSEVSEMLEAYRDHGLKDVTLDSKPEGVGSEAADVLVRLLDTCERYGIDLRYELERKLAYNSTRGYRHGGKRV